MVSTFVWFGILLILLGIVGYTLPFNVTLADTTVNLTIPKVVAFCDSGFGQFSQMLPQVVMVCSEYNNLLMGIYGAGILGIILIAVGATKSGKKDNDSEREVEDGAIDILEKRYAKGEITKEEFDRMKRDLE